MVVEHTSRDDELRRSEQRFRNLVEGSIQGLVVYVDDKPVFANQAMANILGHDGPDDILRMASSNDFVHPGEVERLAAYRRDRLRGEAAPDIYEFRALRKDGSIVWLETRPTVAEWDGQRAIQGTCVDISERKRAEAALSESEARFRDFAEVASDWYWESDAEHRFTEYSVNRSEPDATNEAWSHILGKTRFERRLPGDSADEKWDRHRADLEAHRAFRNFVYETKGANGQSRHVRVSGKPVFDAAGSFVGYRGTGADVTELRQRDAALKQSEQRFRNLAEGSIQGLIVHVGVKPIFANQAIADMLGYDSPHDMLGAGSVEDFLHPSAFRNIHEISAASKRGEALPETVEMKMLCRDGGTLWVEARPTIVEWDGRPATLATIVDITRRKRRDDELRASEQRFRTLAEGSIQGLIVTVDKTPVFANQAFADMLGYDSPEEVLCLDSTKVFLHPADAERALKIRKALVRGESVAEVLEMRALRKDGSAVWIEVWPTLVEWDGEPAIHSAVVDISERKRAEETVQRLAAAMENVSEIVTLYDSDDRLIHFNEAFREVNRVVADGMHLGMTFEEHMRIIIAEGLIPEAVGHEEAWLKNRIERHRNPKGPIEIARKGSKWLLTNEQRLPDGGIISITRDISERRRAEQLFIEQKALLQAVVDAVPAIITVKDRDLRFLMVNRRQAEELGCAPEEAIGKHRDAFPRRGISHEEDRRYTQAQYNHEQEVLDTGLPRLFYEESFIYDSGDVEQRLVSKIPLHDVRGELYAILTVALDITERKNAEDALRQARDELEVKVRERTLELREEVAERKLAQEEATGANQAKSAFLSSMSHELRTPLNAILGFTQLLRDYPDQPLSEEQKGHIEQILDGGKHLLGLVNEVLDLSRIESGRLDLTLEPTPLARAVRDSLVLVQPMAEERDIAISFDAAGASALTVQADPSRLKQVLLNVLSNAVKYNRPEGSVTVTATPAAGGVARVSIRDTGPGIAADKHDGVFRPFSRLGAEASKIEGTGIGLTISRQLVESMGGSLDFTSTPGQGSTFWFELPLADAGAGDV